MWQKTRLSFETVVINTLRVKLGFQMTSNAIKARIFIEKKKNHGRLYFN